MKGPSQGGRQEGGAGVGRCIALVILGLVIAGCSARPPEHGVQFTIAAVTNSASLTPGDLSNIVQVLHRRFRLDGLRAPFVEPAADGTFVLKFPRLSPEKRAEARRSITNAGSVEFRMVQPGNGTPAAGDIAPPGYEALSMPVRPGVLGRQEPAPETYLVKRTPEHGLTGKHLKRAYITRNPISNEPEITFEFDPEGTDRFFRLTTEFSPRDGQFHQVAIVLDGQLHAAPRIMQPISDGRCVLQGGFDTKEALGLAGCLNYPLPVRLRLVDERDF